LGLFLLTTLTMIAFAANSVLGRMAIGAAGEPLIDPASYSAVRLASGAAMLMLLAALTARREGGGISELRGSWASALALFVYAAAFSFAYVALETGLGALILFACVQATMIGWSLKEGDRPSLMEWLGLVTAFGAFVWLVSPGLAAPDPLAAATMAVSGIAWGIYSLRGRGSPNPLQATAHNFLRSTVFLLPLGLIIAATGLHLHVTTTGALLAVLSGAITSGLGYALWYRVLRQIGGTLGAIVQLTVPVIATFGGVVLLDEAWTLRLALSSVLILGGVAVAILARKQRS
jgi:drug/metabolite transporter (DMT)-like permease